MRWVTRVTRTLLSTITTCPGSQLGGGKYLKEHLLKYYLTFLVIIITLLVVMIDAKPGQTSRGGWGVVPGRRSQAASCYNVVQSMLSQLTTDYRVHIRHQTQHRTRVHQIFAGYCIISLARERESSVQSHQSFICEKKTKCPSWLLTNWYVIPGLYQEFTQYIILPSPLRKAVWVCGKYKKINKKPIEKCFW